MTAQEAERRLNMGIAELGLDVKTVNALEEHLGAVWVRDLMGVTRDDLLGIDIFGEETVAHITDVLREFVT